MQLGDDVRDIAGTVLGRVVIDGTTAPGLDDPLGQLGERAEPAHRVALDGAARSQASPATASRRTDTGRSRSPDGATTSSEEWKPWRDGEPARPAERESDGEPERCHRLRPRPTPRCAPHRVARRRRREAAEGGIESTLTTTCHITTTTPSERGAGAGNRTPDLLITSEMLCRLSYSGGRPSVPSFWCQRVCPPRVLHADTERVSVTGAGTSR